MNGPRVIPPYTAITLIPTARPRSPGEYNSAMIATAVAYTIAPPIPWRNLQARSMGALGVKIARNDAAV